MVQMLSWKIASFDELSPAILYRILKLRQDVFIIEQNCPYPDADWKDFKAFHLWAENGESDVVAYSRLLPPGVSYEEASIGRVVTALDIRKSGVGKQLMQRSIEALQNRFGKVAIRIGAQRYLEVFYKSLGFEVAGEPYVEDGIPHIEMLRSANVSDINTYRTT